MVFLRSLALLMLLPPPSLPSSTLTLAISVVIHVHCLYSKLLPLCKSHKIQLLPCDSAHLVATQIESVLASYIRMFVIFDWSTHSMLRCRDTMLDSDYSFFEYFVMLMFVVVALPRCVCMLFSVHSFVWHKLWCLVAWWHFPNAQLLVSFN